MMWFSVLQMDMAAYFYFSLSIRTLIDKNCFISNENRENKLVSPSIDLKTRKATFGLIGARKTYMTSAFISGGR